MRLLLSLNSELVLLIVVLPFVSLPLLLVMARATWRTDVQRSLSSTNTFHFPNPKTLFKLNMCGLEDQDKT